MDSLQTLLLMLFFPAALAYILGVLRPSSGLRKSAKRYPPGPNPLPIIGNLLHLGKNPHKSLANLSKIYGPLMRLKLGTLTSIVVSSPEIAKLVLQTHDEVLSGRIVPQAARSLDHYKFSVVWTSPPDNQWRKLRKLCKETMFSVQKLDVSQGLRREKLQNLFDYVHECSINSQAVDIGRATFTTALNMMSATMFSVDFATFGSESSNQFQDIATGIRTDAGQPNLADYFPVLRKIDPQGIVRMTTVYFTKFFAIIDEIIRERINKRGADGKFEQPKNDMLEELLDINLKNESELSIDDMKNLFLDLFLGGTETISVTMEWIMTELIRNPEKLLKARNELRNVLGQKKQVEESDVSRLPYLLAVVKESFRLHPVVPLLAPHKAKKDVEVNGYLIPKNAQISINVWAMSRDSSIWSDPELFIPERFLDQETDVLGRHFELIPFSAGRRICPGLPMAYRMLHTMVATLINNFDWKLEHGLKCEELNVEEKFGFSLKKAIPLKAIPVKV